MKTGRLVWQLLVRPNLEHAALWWIEGTLQTQIKLHGDCSGRGYGLTKTYLSDSGNLGFSVLDWWKKLKVKVASNIV